MRAKVPKTEVLIFTTQLSADLLGEFLAAGARGCVLKSEPMAHLIEAVRHVACRKPYFAGTTPGNKLNGSGIHLSGRERTISGLVANGVSSKRIAITLGISLRTVETHRSNIMRKLQLGTVADLVRYAVRNGLVIA